MGNKMMSYEQARLAMSNGFRACPLLFEYEAPYSSTNDATVKTYIHFVGQRDMVGLVDTSVQTGRSTTCLAPLGPAWFTYAKRTYGVDIKELNERALKGELPDNEYNRYLAEVERTGRKLGHGDKMQGTRQRKQIIRKARPRKAIIKSKTRTCAHETKRAKKTLKKRSRKR
jgi:hypothetical protein